MAMDCAGRSVSREAASMVGVTRAPSQRARDDEHMGTKVRASHVGSDRTYGARRVWHDLLADGMSCGLHRVERLMRELGLRARPRRPWLAQGSGRTFGHRRQRAGSPVYG